MHKIYGVDVLDEEDVLPCRRCGVKGSLVKMRRCSLWYVRCPECGVKVMWTAPASRAIEMWNGVMA